MRENIYSAILLFYFATGSHLEFPKTSRESIQAVCEWLLSVTPLHNPVWIVPGCGLMSVLEGSFRSHQQECKVQTLRRSLGWV